MKPLELRAMCQKAINDEDADDQSIAFVLVGRSMRGLPVRPTIVSESQNGEKNYMFTVKQARKLLKAIDEAGV